MDWKKDRKNETIQENKEYDPEQVWNIEGPMRRKEDAAKRQADKEKTLNTLSLQSQEQRQKRVDYRNNELSEGQELVAKDLAAKDLERNLIAFKKQLFAQEMTATWEKQNRYKKNMKIVEDEC